MKITDKLLNDTSFTKNLINSFASIEQNIKEGTLWNYGVTSKGVVVLKKTDRIVDKIVFLVKKFFGCIDTSHSSIEELKLRINLAESTNLTDLKDKIKQAKSKLRTTNESVGKAEESLNTNLYRSKQVNANLQAEEKKFKVIEEKLKAIAKEEELETKLQIQRTANQAILKEIEEISENLDKKHGELIESIEKTEFGLDGWIKNADNLIQEKEQALSKYLAEEIGYPKETLLKKIDNSRGRLKDFQRNLEKLKLQITQIASLELFITDWIFFANQQIAVIEKELDSYLPIKPRNDFEVVLNKFRNELQSLREQIPLITNSKEYAEFLSKLNIIETSGWSRVYGNQKYTIGPDDLSTLQKTILCEIRELADLTFRRKQIMGLRT